MLIKFLLLTVFAYGSSDGGYATTLSDFDGIWKNDSIEVQIRAKNHCTLHLNLDVYRIWNAKLDDDFFVKDMSPNTTISEYGQFYVFENEACVSLTGDTLRLFVLRFADEISRLNSDDEGENMVIRFKIQKSEETRGIREATRLQMETFKENSDPRKPVTLWWAGPSTIPDLPIATTDTIAYTERFHVKMKHSTRLLGPLVEKCGEYTPIVDTPLVPRRTSPRSSDGMRRSPADWVAIRRFEGIWSLGNNDNDNDFISIRIHNDHSIVFRHKLASVFNVFLNDKFTFHDIPEDRIVTGEIIYRNRSLALTITVGTMSTVIQLEHTFERTERRFEERIVEQILENGTPKPLRYFRRTATFGIHRESNGTGGLIAYTDEYYIYVKNMLHNATLSQESCGLIAADPTRSNAWYTPMFPTD